MFHRKSASVLALCLGVGLLGCSHDSTNGVGTGTVRVLMTDAPAAVEAIHLVVTEVSINGSVGDQGSWEMLRSDSLTVDLLTLRNGVFTDLALGTVPSGHYRQIRLKLGAGSTVTVDGVVHPLVVPSGLQSGLKIVGDFSVADGGAVVVLLDFDAAKSVHETGNGTWMLQPVVRIMAQPLAGAIGGLVAPVGLQTSVYAIAGVDTVQSTTVGGGGEFLLAMLPGGTYSVAFDAAAGYRDTTLTDVVVTAGTTEDVGTVQLEAPAGNTASPRARPRPRSG